MTFRDRHIWSIMEPWLCGWCVRFWSRHDVMSLEVQARVAGKKYVSLNRGFPQMKPSLRSNQQQKLCRDELRSPGAICWIRTPETAVDLSGEWCCRSLMSSLLGCWSWFLAGGRDQEGHGRENGNRFVQISRTLLNKHEGDDMIWGKIRQQQDSGLDVSKCRPATELFGWNVLFSLSFKWALVRSCLMC